MSVDDDLEILELLENSFPRRHYIRKKYVELDNKTFFQRFRLTKPTVLRHVEILKEDLEYPGDLNDPVSPMNRVSTALRFYATGAHLATIADFMGIHTATACRIIKRVSNLIVNNTFRCPTPKKKCWKYKNVFMILLQFRELSPDGVEAEIFRNRKGLFSRNIHPDTTNIFIEYSPSSQRIFTEWSVMKQE